MMGWEPRGPQPGRLAPSGLGWRARLPIDGPRDRLGLSVDRLPMCTLRFEQLVAFLHQELANGQRLTEQPAVPRTLRVDRVVLGPVPQDSPIVLGKPHGQEAEAARRSAEEQVRYGVQTTRWPLRLLRHYDPHHWASSFLSTHGLARNRAGCVSPTARACARERMPHIISMEISFVNNFSLWKTFPC